jgi:hypothetical protein
VFGDIEELIGGGPMGNALGETEVILEGDKMTSVKRRVCIKHKY